jgi:predicted transcriptional regulator
MAEMVLIPDYDSGLSDSTSSELSRHRWAMYTYIVERTQIYLSKDQATALDREAKRTVAARSHLIRDAIAERYGAGRDRAAIDAALRASAGAWKGRRDDGATYVEKLRSGRRSRELSRSAASRAHRRGHGGQPRG